MKTKVNMVLVVGITSLKEVHRIVNSNNTLAYEMALLAEKSFGEIASSAGWVATILVFAGLATKQEKKPQCFTDEER